MKGCQKHASLVPPSRRGRTPGPSSGTKQERSAILRGAALVCGFCLAVKVLPDSKSPGTEPLSLTKASRVLRYLQGSHWHRT